MTAQALWCVAPDRVELRGAEVGDGVALQCLFSGISRGTERLVSKGLGPPSEYDRMRGPGMEGAFPVPVKYGYCNVARIIEGEHKGRVAFALFPHQSFYRLPLSALTLLPDSLPPERAILAANMETALNILWDRGASAGDRVAVSGAGVVGARVATLASRLPGAEVVLADVNPARADLATSLNVPFAEPEDLPQGCDVVIHTSASEPGLERALSVAGQNATVVEASWYGDRSPAVALGGAFHSRRLRLISSQVGHLPADRQPRWSYGRRMAKAVDLLCDPALDALISGETDFTDLPDVYADILAAPETLCHRIRYTG